MVELLRYCGLQRFSFYYPSIHSNTPRKRFLCNSAFISSYESLEIESEYAGPENKGKFERKYQEPATSTCQLHTGKRFVGSKQLLCTCLYCSIFRLVCHLLHATVYIL